MGFSADLVISWLSLRTIIIFAALQVLSSQSTMSLVTNTENSSELHTPRDICSLELLSCPHPENFHPDHGFFELRFSSNCEPYLNLVCDPGYTRLFDIAYCINNSWEPSVMDINSLCAANCGKPPLVAFANVFLLPGSSDSFDTIDYSEGAEDEQYEHDTDVIYQCQHYTFSSNSNLQTSRCLNGTWEPSPTLDCPANEMKCQGEMLGLVIVGVLFGVETILLTVVLIFCFRRRCCGDQDDTSMAVPNKKHSGNTYTGQLHSSPKTSMEDTPMYPPPRPPARTDTAVVGRENSSYYTYAEVPVETRNNNNTPSTNEDDVSGPGVRRNKSIPQYLEILS